MFSIEVVVEESTDQLTYKLWLVGPSLSEASKVFFSGLKDQHSF
jgi:hypothetical protein